MTGKSTDQTIIDMVVRICPACGVVNPAGPSPSCLHLQLARFDGIEPELITLLDEVAKARTHFETLSRRLKKEVKDAIHSGKVDVETPKKVNRVSDIEALRQQSTSASRQTYWLEYPDPKSLIPKPKNKAKRKHQRSKPPHSLSVDPRQLDLLAKEPPKGHA